MLGLLGKNIKLIGLHGKAGSGKDFIASSCLSDYFKVALANHFKIDVVRKNIFTYAEVFETKPAHVRHRLQQIGTEENRDVYGEDTWCDASEAWMYQLHKSNNLSNFVVADIRFDNEAKWVKSLGGVVIKVESDRNRSGMDETALKHSSEAGISEDLIDHIIVNNIGTDIASLQWQVDMIKQWRGM
jgi:hypothetical protein